MSVTKGPRQYRSVGVMLDRDDGEWMLTVSLWWIDLSWSGMRRWAR